MTIKKKIKQKKENTHTKIVFWLSVVTWTYCGRKHENNASEDTVKLWIGKEDEKIPATTARAQLGVNDTVTGLKWFQWRDYGH